MGKYDDIINLPHHVSKKHPQMSLHDRAAQFAPFAALTGYDEEVREVSRITDQFHPLESKKKEEINQKLCVLQKIQYKHPLISIYYFVPDKRKVGGSYTEMYGRLKNIDSVSYTHLDVYKRQQSNIMTDYAALKDSSICPDTDLCKDILTSTRS